LCDFLYGAVDNSRNKVKHINTAVTALFIYFIDVKICSKIFLKNVTNKVKKCDKNERTPVNVEQKNVNVNHVPNT